MPNKTYCPKCQSEIQPVHKAFCDACGNEIANLKHNSLELRTCEGKQTHVGFCVACTEKIKAMMPAVKFY